MATDWETTQLWGHLKTLDGHEDLKLTCRLLLSKSQVVISSAGTTPIDFTLHDAGHSHRVAERAHEILGGTRLAATETALLLMASYCHDIGMSPSRQLAMDHLSFLLTGEQGNLTSAQQQDVQDYLDAHWEGLEPPLASTLGTVSGVKQFEEVFAYYLRHKHNDWSELWLREHAAEFGPGLYSNWLEDLISLCRSHHEGLAALRLAKFVATLGYVRCKLR
jgi:hypothetical protein